MKRKIVGVICLLTLVCTAFIWVIPTHAAAEANEVIIEGRDFPLTLWYESEAPKINEHSGYREFNAAGNEDDGWQQYSLPIGNGYFGANVFGRTETERIQISEKTLANKRMEIDGVSYGGLNNFSETFIDFGHTDVSDYVRYLDLKTAISGVEYTSGGVKYSREYFTSYPDKALVIRLDADTEGALSFTLRPTVPYEQSYMAKEGDTMGKTGEVVSSVNDGIGYIELSGKLEYYDVDFLGIYKVYTDGGTVTASTAQHTYKDTDGTEITDTDGTIVVSGAKSAYIVVTLGTDYVLSSEVFTTADKEKPTFDTNLDDTRAKVSAEMGAIDAKISGKSFNDAYNLLRSAHVADYSELFSRVTLDIGCDIADSEIPTDELLESYKNGYKSTYLEMLMFQYGRYTLIASSRSGALPAHLQGVWNTYNTAPWGSGYWHNINVQMNYWPAFSTNLAETFDAYVEFNNAFLAEAEKKADQDIMQTNPDAYGKDGGNGWIIGMSSFPFRLTVDNSIGNLGFTTQMFWDYYQYTKDETILEETVYPMLLSAARYITKRVELDENGNYLVPDCDSPEIFHEGVWYYTDGTTYAQTFAYLNNYHVLELAKELDIDLDNLDKMVADGKISADDRAILTTILEQIDKYDPIHVGLSGQIKEFREEDFYSSIGDDPNHRHVAQLSGLYPGNVINSSTPAWLDAAAVSLYGRRLSTAVSWTYPYKAGMYARIKEAELARATIDDLISTDTFVNLYTRGWDIYQADATYGTTAAITEMLLQCNSGYIELLPAIPENWSTGSYTGLCAEGNFEISAAWENGLAKTFNITSKSGGTALLYYPSITSANVVDSKGNKVNYTVSANNLISFETEVGETYIIYGFTKINTPDSPASLVAAKNENGTVQLNWAASSDAQSYNVYVAVENAPTYTLVGNTSATSFLYTPGENESDLRTTYAVTAVNNGESKRALAYTYSDEVLETPYGTVTTSRVEGETFIVFAKALGESEYQFLGTGNNFVDGGLDKARGLLKIGADYYQGGTIVIYLLKDCSAAGTASGAGWNAAPQIDGTVIVDLAGHKLTSTAPRLIGFEAKTSNNGYECVTNFEFKNGEICTSKPIVEILGNSGIYTGTKVINVDFDNVTLTPNGSASTLFVARGSYTDTQKAEFNINFNNCNFEYAGLKGMILVDDRCTANTVDCNVKINRGQMMITSASDFTIDNGFSDEDSLSESNVTYVYTSEVIVTPYGNVSKSAVEGKSFIVFKKSEGASTYTFDKAGTHFADEALDRARQLLRGGRDYQGGTVVIYLIDDCAATGTLSSGSGWNGAPQIDGSVIIDLNGHTLTQTAARLIGFEAKTGNDGYEYATTFEFKNGTIKTSKPLVEVFGSSGIYTGTKIININLDKVTLTPDGSGFNLFTARGSYTSTQKVEFNVDFNECNIQYPDISNMVLINDSCTAGTVDFNVSINGGYINANSLSDLTVSRGFANEDSVIFKLGKTSAKRTEFVLNYTSDAPTEAFNTDDGIKHLASAGIDNSVSDGERKVTYRLSSLSTPYGYVPENQKDTAFSLFYNNLHISSHNNYSQVENRIKELLYPNSYGIYVGETLTLYMKKDYTHTYTPNGNYAQQNGTFILDLGGNTLTMTSGGLFDVVGKAVNGTLYTTSAVIKNGTILTGESPLMILNSKGTSGNFQYDGTKPFTFVFENVTFNKSSAVTSYAPIMSVSRFDETGTKNMSVSAIFNNCTFYTQDTILFDLSISNYVDADIQINGGNIIAENMGSTAIINASDNDDKVTFGKDENGRYSSFALPKDTVSGAIFNGGALVLVKTYENASTVTYRLREKELESFDFTPKMSLTLDEKLLINVYVPKEMLVKFSLGGKDYTDLAALKEYEIDGKLYYLISTPVNAADGMDSLTLIATVNKDGVSANAKFTFSIPKYAVKVIDKGTDIEKQLIKDILSYVRAAYVYFDPTNTNAVSDIDAIIGKDYDATSPCTPTGSTSVPSGFKSATFSLTSTPAIRFYLENGVNESAYSFKINGRVMPYTVESDADGRYVQLDVYAYAMCETVECYYNGTSVGSYHIASYLAWAKTENNASLVNLVERFWKYAESARDYKNSVSVQINYVDENGNELAKSYTNRYKAGEAISLLSPTVDGYYTRDVYLIETLNSKNNVFNVVYKKIPASIDANEVNEILDNIVCWGDSITAGACKTNVTAANQYGIDLEALGSAADGASYVTVLRNLIQSMVYSKISVRGCGVGGESTSTIASRADTETYYLYLNGAVTVSSGAVTIPLTHYSSGGRVGILRQGDASEINPITIKGKDLNGNDISVTGSISISLTADAPSGTDIRTCNAKYLQYTFTRDDGKTDTLSFAPGARVITKASYLYDGRTCIIFMGENGGYSDVNELIKQQEEILKACGNPEFYLIISTTSGSYESRTEIRDALTRRWGERYINMGDELNSSRKAYELVGYSNEAINSVLGNIANGTVTNLLIADTCHPNAVGYAAVGNIIFERLFRIGAFDGLFDYYDTLNESFTNKTITFLGDSITYGVGTSGTQNRYSSQVASSLGMTEINMGISGTVMCTGGHRSSRLGDIQNISLESDYVGILLGINDFDQCRNNESAKYYSLGEFGSKDTSTIYGALDKMCSDLVARFGATDTKVFLMTPVITSWNNSVSGVRDWDQGKVNACGYTLRDLCDAIETVAAHYGIATLDLNELCVMNESDFSDGIHPNDAGAKKMADTIKAFLLANYTSK